MNLNDKTIDELKVIISQAEKHIEIKVLETEIERVKAIVKNNDVALEQTSNKLGDDAEDLKRNSRNLLAYIAQAELAIAAIYTETKKDIAGC